ncbi:hypothetical protein PMIN01_00892 [Paraphaeosphaeria minitans]|uniref:Uncharacterized protein n=1 Tax=Paraphaeosphaeria minitans TaxID=565426 RepID=A0A9P6KVW1_9PLEO|nr:hypothetical protein PMIN01_00892 [Paraphaeosphaeria minitans]
MKKGRSHIPTLRPRDAIKVHNQAETGTPCSLLEYKTSKSDDDDDTVYIHGLWSRSRHPEHLEPASCCRSLHNARSFAAAGRRSSHVERVETARARNLGSFVANWYIMTFVCANGSSTMARLIDLQECHDSGKGFWKTDYIDEENFEGRGTVCKVELGKLSTDVT